MTWFFFAAWALLCVHGAIVVAITEQAWFGLHPVASGFVIAATNLVALGVLYLAERAFLR